MNGPCEPLLQAPSYGYISVKTFGMHSNLTQWKRAGLITLKSLDRNQELLLAHSGESFCALNLIMIKHCRDTDTYASIFVRFSGLLNAKVHELFALRTWALRSTHSLSSNDVGVRTRTCTVYSQHDCTLSVSSMATSALTLTSQL